MVKYTIKDILLLAEKANDSNSDTWSTDDTIEDWSKAELLFLASLMKQDEKKKRGII